MLAGHPRRSIEPKTPATIGTTPSTTNAGRRHRPSGAAALTSMLRARSSTSALARVTELLGQPVHRLPHRCPGLVCPADGTTEVPELRMGRHRAPDLRGIDADLEPVMDAEELLPHWTAEGVADRHERGLRSRAGVQAGGKQVDAGRQVVDERLAPAYDGRVLGPGEHHPHGDTAAEPDRQADRSADHRPPAACRCQAQHGTQPHQQRTFLLRRRHRTCVILDGGSPRQQEQHRHSCQRRHHGVHLRSTRPAIRSSQSSPPNDRPMPRARHTRPAVEPVRKPTGSPPIPDPSRSTPTGRTASILAVA